MAAAVCCIVTSVFGLVVAILGIVLGFAVFPGLVDDGIIEKLVIAEGSQAYDYWETTPFPLDLKVYIWNVDNPEDVKNGAKPIMREIGPYVYKEYRYKRNITEKNGRLSYDQYNRIEFDAPRSGDLSESDEVDVLNIPMTNMIQIADSLGPVESEAALLFINTNLRRIFVEGSDIIVRTTVKKLLFDGIRFCPNYNNTLSPCYLSIAANALKSKNVVSRNNTLYFSLLDYKQEKPDGPYTIMDGSGDIADIGKIVEWRGGAELDIYPGGENATCNLINGTDTTIYRPFIKRSMTLQVFNSDICRSVNVYHRQDTTYKGVNTLRFTLYPDMFEAPTEENGTMCFCANKTVGITQENGCVKAGVMEAYPCVDAPIILSFPHMLWADKDYLESVEGMRPNESLHLTFVDLDPNLGVPMNSAKMVQFNMFLRRVRLITVTQKLRDVRLFPIMWVSEGASLEDEYMEDIYQLYDILYILDVVKWCLIGIGLFVAIVFFFLVLYRRKVTEDREIVYDNKNEG